MAGRRDEKPDSNPTSKVIFAVDPADAPFVRELLDLRWRARQFDSSSPEPSFRRIGDGWRLLYGGLEIFTRHQAGMTYIARLLDSPRHQVRADEFGSLVVDAGTFQPRLDADARRAYCARIDELGGEISRREAEGDDVEELRAERSWLCEEIKRARGLGGRDRPLGAGNERTRHRVSTAVRRAIASIRRVHPELAAHLAESIRLGRTCSYQPDRDVSWEV